MREIIADLHEQAAKAALTETRAKALIDLAKGLEDHRFTGSHHLLTLLAKACEQTMPIPAVVPFAEVMYDYMCRKYIPFVNMPELCVSGVVYEGNSLKAGGGTNIVTLEPDAGAVAARAFAAVGKSFSHGHYALTEEGFLNFYPEVEEPLPSDAIQSYDFQPKTTLDKGPGWRITGDGKGWKLTDNGQMELKGAMIEEATIQGPVNTCEPGRPVPCMMNFVPEGEKTLLYESSSYKPFGGKRIYSCANGSHLIVSCDELGEARVSLTTNKEGAEEAIYMQSLIDSARGNRKISSKKVRIAALEVEVQALKAELAAYKEGGHMNNSGTLPPVDCDLLIKLPAGSYPHAEQAGLTLDIDEDLEMRVRRCCHVQSRGQDLTYVMHRGLKELFRFKGQFDWTYP